LDALTKIIELQIIPLPFITIYQFCFRSK